MEAPHAGRINVVDLCKICGEFWILIVLVVPRRKMRRAVVDTKHPMRANLPDLPRIVANVYRQSAVRPVARRGVFGSLAGDFARAGLRGLSALRRRRRLGRALGPAARLALRERRESERKRRRIALPRI